MAKKPTYKVAKQGPVQKNKQVRTGTARNKTSKGGIFGKWYRSTRIRNVRSA